MILRGRLLRPQVVPGCCCAGRSLIVMACLFLLMKRARKQVVITSIQSIAALPAGSEDQPLTCQKQLTIICTVLHLVTWLLMAGAVLLSKIFDCQHPGLLSIP